MRAVVVLATIACLAAGPAGSQSPRAPRGGFEWQRVRQALDEGGIPAAAAVFGRYEVSDFRCLLGIPADAAALAGASHAVIVGRPLTGVASLSDDRRHINTEWTVLVERTLKGAPVVAPGRRVAVTVPGGEVRFANGTSAVVRAPEPLARGGRYLLFLELIESAAVAAQRGRVGSFVPAYGPLGVFAIDGDPARVRAVDDGTFDAPSTAELLGSGEYDEVLERAALAVLAAGAHPGSRRLTGAAP